LNFLEEVQRKYKAFSDVFPNQAKEKPTLSGRQFFDDPRIIFFFSMYNVIP